MLHHDEFGGGLACARLAKCFVLRSSVGCGLIIECDFYHLSTQARDFRTSLSGYLTLSTHLRLNILPRSWAPFFPFSNNALFPHVCFGGTFSRRAKKKVDSFFPPLRSGYEPRYRLPRLSPEDHTHSKYSVDVCSLPAAISLVSTRHASSP